MNDSVLAQSYVEAYDISYPEAIRRIEEEVVELKEVLSEEGSYTLNDLGELTINQEGNIEFAPCQAGILSPELYGLADFNFNTLKANVIVGNADEKPETVVKEKAKTVRLEVASNVEKKEDVAKEATEDETKETPVLLDFTDDDDGSIHIKKSWIRNTVAVAAAIVAFFLLSTPVVNSELGNSTMSNIQNNILYKLIPQDTNIMNAQPVKAEMDNKAAELKADSSKMVAKAETNDDVKADSVVVSKPTYLVVLASQVKMKNAELFVENLHKKGYPQAEVFVYNNVVRVVCGEYNNEAEAYRMVNKMNTKEEFADAWVFKKKAQI